MTENAQQDEQPFRNPSAPEPDKPTGGHPIAAVVGGIPKTGLTTITPGMTTGTPSAPHVTSRTVAVLPDYNAVAVLVPPDTTDEQVAQLLQRFKKARFDETLEQYIPPTTKGNKLGPHAIADIYVFSEREWATPDTLRVVALGPHSPQDPRKKGGPTFAEAISHVRGRYVINLHEAEHRERGSIGYADEDGGTHAPNYKELF